MFRGTIYYLQKKRIEAFADYKEAGHLYESESNMPLAIEAYRMAGKTGLKNGMKVDAVKILAQGALLGAHIDAQTAYATTYAGLLQLLTGTSHESIISHQQLSSIASPLFGGDWYRIVQKWGKIPDNAATAEQIEKMI